MVTLTFMDILIIASIVWLPIIFQWCLSQRAKDKSEIENGKWDKNTGSRPALFNVDVVFKNGQLRKYVSAKGLNWDLLAKNPIVKYRKALK